MTVNIIDSYPGIMYFDVFKEDTHYLKNIWLEGNLNKFKRKDLKQKLDNILISYLTSKCFLTTKTYKQIHR